MKRKAINEKEITQEDNKYEQNKSNEWGLSTNELLEQYKMTFCKVVMNQTVDDLNELLKQVKLNGINLKLLFTKPYGRETETHLTLAIRHNNTEMASVLLNQCLTIYQPLTVTKWINLKILGDVTALDLAIEQRNLEKVTLLLDHGADPAAGYDLVDGYDSVAKKMSSRGSSFMRAIATGNADIIKQLLEFDAKQNKPPKIDLNAVDVMNNTPLMALLNLKPQTSDEKYETNLPLLKTYQDTFLKLLETPGVNVDLSLKLSNRETRVSPGQTYKTLLTTAINNQVEIGVIQKILLLKKRELIVDEFEVVLALIKKYPQQDFFSNCWDLMLERNLKIHEAKSVEEKSQYPQPTCRYNPQDTYYYYQFKPNFENTEIKKNGFDSLNLISRLKKVDGDNHCLFSSNGITRGYYVDFLKYYFQIWRACAESGAASKENFIALCAAIRDDIRTMFDSDLALKNDEEIKQKKASYDSLYREIFGNSSTSPYSELVDAFLKVQSQETKQEFNEAELWHDFNAKCQPDTLLSHLDLYRYYKYKLWPSLKLIIKFAEMRHQFKDQNGDKRYHVVWQQSDHASRQLSLLYPSEKEFLHWSQSGVLMQNIVFHISQVHFDQLILLDFNDVELIHLLCIEAAGKNCFEPMKNWYKNNIDLTVGGIQYVFALFKTVIATRNKFLRLLLDESGFSVEVLSKTNNIKETDLQILKQLHTNPPPLITSTDPLCASQEEVKGKHQNKNFGDSSHAEDKESNEYEDDQINVAKVLSLSLGKTGDDVRQKDESNYKYRLAITQWRSSVPPASWGNLSDPSFVRNFNRYLNNTTSDPSLYLNPSSNSSRSNAGLNPSNSGSSSYSSSSSNSSSTSTSLNRK